MKLFYTYSDEGDRIQDNGNCQFGWHIFHEIKLKSFRKRHYDASDPQKQVAFPELHYVRNGDFSDLVLF